MWDVNFELRDGLLLEASIESSLLDRRMVFRLRGFQWDASCYYASGISFAAV